MGLADDGAEAKRIGGRFDDYQLVGETWEQFKRRIGEPIERTPEYCAMSECSRRMAQMIGRARAETKAAKDAVTDHASRYFVLQQIERILEALQ